MFKKLWQHKWALATLAGISVFLAFPCFYVVPTILLFPMLTLESVRRCTTGRQAFLVGFVTSFFIMLGGFYWVTFVIHEFGYLPWAVSGLLFLGFCGFGAVNFPAFTWIVYLLDKRWSLFGNKRKRELWLVLGFPALYSLVEYFVPKLFPWYLGHCLFLSTWLIQLVEFTGSLVLTFALFSTGGVLYDCVLSWMETKKLRVSALAFVPLLFWGASLIYASFVLKGPIEGHPLRVALVQANIGSLEKVAARRGYDQKMRHTLDIYLRLTEKAVAHDPPPHLILWPETAMPFQMENESGKYAAEVRENVKKWKVPLITGGYGVGSMSFNSDYNTAFLLDPQPDGTIRTDRYHKNILLAFGEYMPLGEWFPSLYRMFPEVSNFERGKIQNPFTLSDTTRLGITICYEAIVPNFYRKVAKNEINAIVNLTNDSWFGPTAEPYLHGALTVFRAVETRLPLIRVTNTGISFTVDQRGRRSETTGVYEEGLLVNEVHYAPSGTLTVYTLYGDWIVLVLALLLVVVILSTIRKPHVPLSS